MFQKLLRIALQNGCIKNNQSSKNTFRTKAAHKAPAMGATINNHNCCKAIPPAKRAGPKLRAGFTDVPVIGK